jgi:hypothetical protein
MRNPRGLIVPSANEEDSPANPLREHLRTKYPGVALRQALSN